MNIYIETQHFIGDMGFGWKDQKPVALAYAKFISRRWRKSLSLICKQGHSIKLNIGVKQGVTRLYAPILISCCNPDLALKVRNTLPHEDVTWKEFVKSEEVSKHLIF